VGTNTSAQCLFLYESNNHPVELNEEVKFYHYKIDIIDTVRTEFKCGISNLKE